jgi:lysophospholipase L1-like esterase
LVDSTEISDSFSFDNLPPEHLRKEISKALSIVLRAAGVRYKFSIQNTALKEQIDIAAERTFAPTDQTKPTQRLWVRCESRRSLDFSLLAEELARQLRSLNLVDFRDAVFRCQAPGVTDWRLRIDLTPPAILLHNWAGWGDIQAITRLTNLVLRNNGLQVSGILKNWRLHLFCCVRGNTVQFPNKQQAIETIVPLLTNLSPQGIQGATIYGVQAMSDGLPSEHDSPFWTHWLDLPGALDPRYTLPPLALAEQGNEDALKFILQRLLNPDMDYTFTNGGIGLSLLRRKGILHIMSEAPACPLESQIVDSVSKVLRQISFPNIIGARIYGRIAGQQNTVWNYGLNFGAEVRQLPSQTTGLPLQPISFGWQEWFLQKGWLCPSNSPPEALSQKVIALWLTAGLLLVLGLDLGGRWLATQTPNIASKSSPIIASAQLSYGNPLFDEKVLAYQQLCTTKGVPEVLIVGSSRAMRGIEPQVLEQGLVQRGYTQARVYNFGINGATAQMVELLLRRLIAAQQLPKLVIWADGARAFNNGRPDRTYNSIAESPGFQQLPGSEGAAIAKSQPLIINGYASIDSFLNKALAKISFSYGRRDQVKQQLQKIVPHWPGQVSSTNDAAKIDVIDKSGFLALENEFEPNTYYQKYAKVAGESDNDYADFSFTGSQDAATRQTLAFLKQQHIPVVFVNMPLSDRYLDSTRQKYEFDFKQYMQSLVKDGQLQFIDLVGLWMQEYNLYSDPSHLNRAGAVQVSTYLAQTSPIDWQVIAPTK